MATLDDLERQESHNFVYTLLNAGETPTLRRLREELEDARRRGDYELARKYETHDNEIGLAVKRFTELEADIQIAMRHANLTPDFIQRVIAIFNRHPNTLQELDQSDQDAVTSYWMRKKSVMQRLTDLHYTVEEVCQ